MLVRVVVSIRVFLEVQEEKKNARSKILKFVDFGFGSQVFIYALIDLTCELVLLLLFLKTNIIIIISISIRLLVIANDSEDNM